MMFVEEVKIFTRTFLIFIYLYVLGIYASNRNPEIAQSNLGISLCSLDVSACSNGCSTGMSIHM